MQDGEFFYQGQRQTIGKAVFIFAGGTSATFRGFAREEESTEQDRFHFVQAKGPDFVSRLSGHVDVLGVNRREDMPDQAYVLRRAAIIRSELKRKNLIGRTNRALVERRFIRTLLEIGRYKHGVRSLTKSLDMCIGPDGLLHMPPPDQLGMHVDKSDADALMT